MSGDGPVQKRFTAMVVKGVLACCLACVSLVRAQQPPNVSGHFVTRDGKTVNFVRTTARRLEFVYGPEDKRSDVPFEAVAKIVFGAAGGSARIELKDGRVIDARTGGRHWSVGNGYLGYSYFDDVAGKVATAEELYAKISTLVFDEFVGHFRRCPHCKGLWPDAYMFCPHDGVRTVWGEPSGALTMEQAQATPEERAARRASVMEALLNASLARAGVDPAAPESQKAKEFGKLWMNPAADPKEIHQKLDEFREEWRRKGGGE